MALVQIYTCRDAMEAHLLRGLLAERGITAVVMGETLAGVVGALPFGSVAYPTLWVNPMDELRARAFVLDLEEKRVDGGSLEPAAAEWTCPNCGESIERQFTDCWKCRTPRPFIDAGKKAVEPAVAGSVQCDLPCISCGYNLRSLTARGRCPECGLPVLKTLLDMVSVGISPDPAHVSELLSQTVDSTNDRPYRGEAMAMVCHACLRAASPQGSTCELTAAQFTARFAEAFRSLAIERFGDREEAIAGLRGWGVRASEDVRQVISVLCEHGLLESELATKLDRSKLKNALEGLL